MLTVIGSSGGRRWAGIDKSGKDPRAAAAAAALNREGGGQVGLPQGEQTVNPLGETYLSSKQQCAAQPFSA